MTRFVSDFLFVVVLAATLWVAAWFVGDFIGGYRRQVDALVAELEAANDHIRTLEFRLGRLKAQVGSAAAEILERRTSPEESYEMLLKAVVIDEK